MTNRDYDQCPVEVAITVKLFAYGPINQQQLQQQFSKQDNQEALLMWLSEFIPQDTGLDDVIVCIN